MGYLEDTVAASVEKHGKMLDSLRVSHARQDADIGKVERNAEIFTALEQRINAMETMWDRVAVCEQSNNSQLQVHAAMEAVQSKIAERLNKLELKCNLVGTHTEVRRKDPVFDHISTLTDRLETTEQLVRDTC